MTQEIYSYESWSTTWSNLEGEKELEIRAMKNYIIYAKILKTEIDEEGTARAFAKGKNVNTLVLLIETVKLLCKCYTKMRIESCEVRDKNDVLRIETKLRVKFYDESTYNEEEVEEDEFEGFYTSSYSKKKFSSILNAKINRSVKGEVNSQSKTYFIPLIAIVIA